jgi:hypothetical protein
VIDVPDDGIAMDFHADAAFARLDVVPGIEAPRVTVAAFAPATAAA